MAVRTKRFPEYDLSLCIVSGGHTCEEAVRYFEALGPRDALRWLHCFDPTQDMSGHDVACLPRLKSTIAAKRKALFGRKPKLYGIVCPSKAGAAFFEFWRSYIEAADSREAAPLLFPSLEAACEAFGLSEPAREAVIREVEDKAEEPPRAPAARSSAPCEPAPEPREHSPP